MPEVRESRLKGPSLSGTSAIGVPCHSDCPKVNTT